MEKEGILGRDFLDSHKTRINYKGQSVELELTFREMVIRIPFQQTKRDKMIQVNRIETQIIQKDEEKKNNRIG